MPSAKMYECTAQILTDGGFKLSKYKSTKSGMTVCIAEANGPIVAGYMCVATEAHDDDGLPHTLEHLIFMGSESYPYKGVLDIIATRCLSQGTNAWTDTDHTCYTVTTAGDEGFLNLLPIYLDHVLSPTLTDLSYVTEVHHITGEGEDAGVVYCEMQTRENSGENRCHYAMLHSMYPGDCGYKYETGGCLKNLRESTSNEKVKQYHKTFYRPENICVIIVGNIDAEKVFKAIKPVEERMLQDKREQFDRPWQSSVPPLLDSITHEVEYSSDEEDYGMIIAAWRGPLANEYSKMIAIQVLMDYLTDTPVSPLSRELIEIDDPLCNQVDYTIVENSVSCIYVHLSNVPTKKLNNLKEKLLSVLQYIANGEEELDMTRLKTIIRKKKLYILTCMESNPHDQLASGLIADFLYGSSLEDLKMRVQEIPIIESLYNEPAEFWVNLLKTYITEANHVIVLGKPSLKFSEKLSTEEKQRIEAQQKELGPDGLKEKADLLKSAITAAEVDVPKEVLCSVASPSLESIKYHPIQRTCNHTENSTDLGFDISSMPCRFQLDVIKTNFVRYLILMDSSTLSQGLRMYLPLLVEIIGECAINRNGKIIPYQDVVKQLEEDTISVSSVLGLNYRRFFCGKFAQTVGLEFTVEEEKYEKSVQWAREMLFQSVFEPARIKCTINKMVSALGTLKRKGGSILKTVLKNIVFQRESNHWTANMLRQSNFLSNLLVKLETNAEEVIADLNSVCEALTQPDKIIVHLAINLDTLKEKIKPEKPWLESFIPTYLQPKIRKSPIKKCYELLKEDGEVDHTGLIVGIGAMESSSLLQCAPCIRSYTDPDYAPLLVLIQYLVQMEGPMWRQIRGQGLAYSYNVMIDPDCGLIYLVISDSNHLLKCFNEAKDIVESHLDGITHWEEEFVEASRSGVLFEIIECMKTVSDVMEESLRYHLAGIDMHFPPRLLKLVSEVTEDDLQRVGNKYLRPLFDSNVSNCAVCCNPNRVNQIIEGFQKFSRNLHQLPSLDVSSLTEF